MSDMQNERQEKKLKSKKNFFAKIIDMLDKKLEDRTKSTNCCNNSKKDKGGSCC